MTNPFERHGIKHLSASSLQTYSTEPALWVIRYLYGIKDNAGPSAWRGTAVEAGLKLVLYGTWHEDAVAAALAQYDMEAMGEISDKIAQQRALIPDMIHQAVKAFQDWGTPDAVQFRVEHWIDGIEVPLLGYVDFLYPADLADLKTTEKCPSSPKMDHAVQVVLYADALKRKPYLAYVTAKKSAVYGPEDIDMAQARWLLKVRAHALRHMLSLTVSKEHAANMFAPNFESYLWSETTRSAAKQLIGR